MLSHHADRGVELLPLGRELLAAQVIDGGLVRVDVADARAAFDRHVADRHPLVHRHPVDGVAGIFVGVADPTVHAEAADDLEDDVLGVDPGRQPARHADAADLQRIHRQALRREHVADLRGPDPEGDRAERAVSGGVAVAARDGHPGLGEAELRPDHVHDALRAAAQVEQRNPRFPGVPLERREHVLRHPIAERPPLVAGRDDVVDGRDGAIGIPHLQPARPQHVEGLGRRDLVNQVQADEKLRLAVRERADGVKVPDLLEKRRGHCGMVLLRCPLVR